MTPDDRSGDRPGDEHGALADGASGVRASSGDASGAEPAGATFDRTLLAAGEASDEASRSSRSGRREARYVDRFALLRKLGEGGMGIVYAAYDEDLERRVAVKLLRSGDPLRMLREAQALARLSHPNVVQIYQVGRTRDEVYVAMEHVVGPTLDLWLRTTPRTTLEILGVFTQAARGLAAAHASGLVHRDFKPSNVIVGDDGRVRVLDFGLARDRDARDAPTPPEQSAELGPRSALLSPLTAQGAVLGTPAYMSPEQLTGLRVDARSDQFSLCVALFEALHGRRPFAGETLAELMHSVTRGAVVATPPRPDLPPAVDAALRRGLSADAAARWPDLDALVAVLERADVQQRSFLGLRAVIWLSGLVTLLAIASTLLGELLVPPESVTPATLVVYGAVTLAGACAIVATLWHRLRAVKARPWLLVVLGTLAMSALTRVATWRTGLDPRAMVITETLVYAAIFLTLAALLRAPAFLFHVALLLGGLALVVEADFNPRLLAPLWVVTISLGFVVVARRSRSHDLE